MGKAEILLKVIKDSGIDAFWIKNGVAKRSDNLPKDLQSIHEVHEILNLYEW